ncbi:MAG: dehydrogenase [Proteobacteria bacterium]|nr:dehydrogenase [Pseudomonadota bacterium]
MITRSKAPLRLGLAGGGTDVSPFCDVYGGAVLNATISLYAYCTIEDLNNNEIIFNALDFEVKEQFLTSDLLNDEGLRLHRGVYRRIVRDFLNNTPPPISIATFCDAPPGSGLGSSSTLVVAMLHAYVEHFNLPLGEYDIAHLAYEIERVDLKLDGGKQDQYAAAFGGVNFMEFYDNDKVIVNPLRIRPQTLAELESSLVLFYTGVSRDSDKIIQDQIQVTSTNKNNLDAMKDIKDMAFVMKEHILKGNIKGFAECLVHSWQSKKKTSTKVSNLNIDKIYNDVMQLGAYAGKVSGAGGGGFMMFIVDFSKKLEIIRYLERQEGYVMRCHFSHDGAHAWRV